MHYYCLKVKNAEEHGAVGAILYRDPAGLGGVPQDPGGWRLPGWAVQVI